MWVAIQHNGNLGLRRGILGESDATLRTAASYHYELDAGREAGQGRWPRTNVLGCSSWAIACPARHSVAMAIPTRGTRGDIAGPRPRDLEKGPCAYLHA